jgi:hypothetical protein
MAEPFGHLGVVSTTQASFSFSIFFFFGFLIPFFFKKIIKMFLRLF